MVRFLPASEKDPAGSVAPPAWSAWESAPAFRPASASFLSSGTTETWRLLHPVHRDLADALDVLEGGDDRAVQLVGERLLVLVGGDGEDHGRDVVRGTGDDLRVDGRGQLGAGPVDRLLDVRDELLGALVAEVEGRHDEGVALAGGGGDALDAVDGLEEFSSGSTTCFSTTSGDAPG